jgi:hypothetical protein
MAKRIAFGCESGVGKDTAVDYLMAKHPGVRLSFAGAIYDILYHAEEVCGFPKEKDREFLQSVGTWVRKRDPDVWVRIVCEKIKSIPQDVPIYITDLRQQNEMDALLHLGFTVVRMTRPFGLRNNFGTGNRTHSTEVELLSSPAWDCIIENDGTLQELHQKLDMLYDLY